MLLQLHVRINLKLHMTVNLKFLDKFSMMRIVIYMLVTPYGFHYKQTIPYNILNLTWYFIFILQVNLFTSQSNYLACKHLGEMVEVFFGLIYKSI